MITNSARRTPNSLIEFIFLIGLVITLPLLEAPKNLFWLAFTITWILNRRKSGHLGGPWDAWDNLIALWIISGYFVSAFAGLHHSEWGGANDILRYGSIFWMIKRSGYGRSELQWILAAIIFSTFIALSFALWSLKISHTRHLLELNSVGHVNHSAIYMTISYGAALSALLAYWKQWNFFWRLTGGLITLFFAFAVVISDSRAAVGAAFLLTVILATTWLRRSKKIAVLLLAAVIMVAAVSFIAKIDVIKKQEAVSEEGHVLNHRDLIWHGAVVAWKEFPWFGVGMHNYNQISIEKIKIWVEASGKQFNPSQYSGSAHGHSLYFTALAERGTVGFAVLVAVLLSWLYWLIRFLPKPQDENIEWALWGSSIAAWLVSVGIGFVNTTLHHEHAILSVLLLGMWLAYLRLKKDSAGSPILGGVH